MGKKPNSYTSLKNESDAATCADNLNSLVAQLIILTTELYTHVPSKNSKMIKIGKTSNKADVIVYKIRNLVDMARSKQFVIIRPYNKHE